MPTELIDISLSVSPTSVVWPSAPQPQLTRRLAIAQGDTVNDSNLFMNVHTGTHIDAPRHHFEQGYGADRVPLEALVGDAWVVDFTGEQAIEQGLLQRLWPPAGASRLLCRTRNSQYWENGRRDFTADYCALTADAAAWLVERKIKLLGVDYLSVQQYADSPAVHRILLKAGVVLLEGLNLSQVRPGPYELLCLPLKLADADGAPARAVLRRFG